MSLPYAGHYIEDDAKGTVAVPRPTHSYPGGYLKMSEFIKFAQRENELYVVAPQRFCAPEAGNLLDHINAKIDKIGIRHLNFDLSACNYMDSTVLGQLVALHRRMGTGGLTLSKPSPEARQILLIMGLDKLLSITEDNLPTDLNFQDMHPERKNDAQDVLEAHLLLSQISPDNARRFATLIKTLHQSIDHDKK